MAGSQGTDATPGSTQKPTPDSTLDPFDPFLDRRDPDDPRTRLGMSFRTRLTLALIVSAVLPTALFGLVIVAFDLAGGSETIVRVLLIAIVAAALLGLFIAYLVAADVTGPLRAIAAAVDRVSAGDMSTPIRVAGDDEIARLAESHNRMAADSERRDRQLVGILSAVAAYSPRDGVEWLTGRAAEDVRTIFELIDARVTLVHPDTVPDEEIVPGDPRPVRAEVRAGDERLGLVLGHVPATRNWERADQHLVALFASELGVAIRNAELFARVRAQNDQLVELDAAKDDFLRGVSHNLQTPLTSIRAYAEQLRRDGADSAASDRRLGIIAEQSERLSRLVRQLLTVTRLESGALHPESDVFALGPRVRRAWEACAVEQAEFSLDDNAQGWLAVADGDQLDQVLWALLDNALKYGGHSRVDAEIAVDERNARVRLTVADHGPGVAEPDRSRLFSRFARGGGRNAEDGSGLGLYVSRELARAMNGDLVLEPAAADRGAAFSLYLPGEPPEDA